MHMMEEQLARIETKLDEVHKIVHQHVGFIAATKALLAGIGAAFMAALAFIGFTRH